MWPFPPTRKLALCLALVLISTACARRINSNIPVTPYENAMVLNAQLSTINQAVSLGVQQVVDSSILPYKTGKPIVDATIDIANVDTQITAILQLGPEFSKANAAQLQTLLSKITDSVKSLATSGALGIKNPKTQNEIALDISSIGNLASSILINLRQAGVL